jgi:precorrin-2 dehydrogenase/sirohydrochlorin ferrochelatase
MPDLPVMLRIEGKRCVIVGGGPVARRRAAALLEAGGRVTVVAPQIDPDLAAMSVTVERRAYRETDLDGAFLVVVATGDDAVNAAIGEDARRRGVLVNRADEPTEGDFTVPAHARHGPITLAVHTGGVSAGAGAAIRRELSAALDPAWPRLLELVAPFRSRIQDATPEPDVRQEAPEGARSRSCETVLRKPCVAGRTGDFVRSPRDDADDGHHRIARAPGRGGQRDRDLAVDPR